MILQELKITNRHGIHARPSSMISELAHQFDGSITVIKDGRTADARSVMELILLAVEPGATISLQIDGEDEQATLQAFIDLIVIRKFDEETI